MKILDIYLEAGSDFILFPSTSFLPTKDHLESITEYCIIAVAKLKINLFLCQH